MGKSIIFIVIFNSYVCLPEGIIIEYYNLVGGIPTPLKNISQFSTFPLAAAVSRAAMTEACLACFVHLKCTTYAPPTAKDGVWTLHGRHMVLCVPITC